MLWHKLPDVSLMPKLRPDVNILNVEISVRVAVILPAHDNKDYVFPFALISYQWEGGLSEWFFIPL